jgi:type II secretory pathway component PulJ
MRRGYLLVEMIVVLFVLAMIAATLERFWVTFVYELPRNSRLIQESRVLNSVVNCIRADVVSAKTLAVSDGNSAESASLLMETPDGIISYKFSDGRISRSSPDAASGDIVWSAPHSRIDWQVWNKDKTAYAVEISTYIEDKRFGHTRKKMANSFLFFTGTCLEGVE